MKATIAPSRGFVWMFVSWRAPDQTRTTICSYCAEPLRESEMPLILWNVDGWCAEFCENCQRKWWGMEVLNDDDGG